MQIRSGGATWMALFWPLTDPDHPLALDTTSPLHTDFTPQVWNQIYRSTPSIKKAKAMA